MITLDRNIFKSYQPKSNKTVHVYLKELLDMQLKLIMRDKQDFLVSKLVAHRLVSELAGKTLKNSYEFKVRWLGYQASEDTWLPWVGCQRP